MTNAEAIAILSEGADMLVGTKKAAEEEGRLVIVPENGMGELSDGYHTFNELYEHRAVLFSFVCSVIPGLAWKSKLHDDGTMFDGMFIVGMETPGGQVSYHYDIDPYWDLFKVRELPTAPTYDGHTAQDVLSRIREFGECLLEESRNDKEIR